MMENKSRRRITGWLLALVMLCLCLSACGDDGQGPAQSAEPVAEATEAPDAGDAGEAADDEDADSEDSDDEDTDSDDEDWGDDDSDDGFGDEFGDVEIKESPDKYTWYVNNYVGQNLASFGYTSMGGDRMDEYGEGLLKIIPVTEDGSYINIEKDKELAEYMVVAQDLEPNTEIKYIFEKDSKGKEYDNLIDSQNYEEIVLLCRKVNGDAPADPVKTDLTPIDPADRHNYPIRDYVGRNLMYCGYTSMGGDRMDEYDDVRIEFQFVTTDGSYVNPEKEKELKQYYVTAQSVSPNKVMKVKYEKRNGKEEYYLIKSQSIEKVKLKLAKVSE